MRCKDVYKKKLWKFSSIRPYWKLIGLSIFFFLHQKLVRRLFKRILKIAFFKTRFSCGGKTSIKKTLDTRGSTLMKIKFAPNVHCSVIKWETYIKKFWKKKYSFLVKRNPRSNSVLWRNPDNWDNSQHVFNIFTFGKRKRKTSYGSFQNLRFGRNVWKRVKNLDKDC